MSCTDEIAHLSLERILNPYPHLTLTPTINSFNKSPYRVPTLESLTPDAESPEFEKANTASAAASGAHSSAHSLSSCMRATVPQPIRNMLTQAPPIPIPCVPSRWIMSSDIHRYKPKLPVRVGGLIIEIRRGTSLLAIVSSLVAQQPQTRSEASLA